jgi:hypothetical protein
MKYLTYLALVASVDAKWTPLKDLKEFHEKHPHPVKDWAEHHKHPLRDAKKWLKKEFKKVHKTEEEVQLDKAKLEAIVQGVLQGALHAEHFDDINHCIADAEHVFGDAEAAYKDFKAGGANHVIDGMKQIADLLKTVKTGMQDCSSLKADWTKLEAMVAVFSNPTSFAYHVGKDLMVNGQDIFQEIETAVSDYEAGNWENFGYQVGEAAAKTILGNEPAARPGQGSIKTTEILRGVIEAYGGHFDLDALLACVHDEDQALLILNAAFGELKAAVEQKSVQDLIGGVIATVAGLQQLKAGLPVCEQIDTTSWDYDGFSNTFEMMKNPVAFFKPVAEDVLIHGLPILVETDRAVRAMEKEDYYGYGVQVGKILNNATGARKEFQAEPKLADVDREMAAKVASGLLSSTAVGSFNFQDLLLCIYEADGAAMALEAAAETIEQAYKDKSVQEAVAGAVGALAFVQALKQTIPVCESVDASKMDWTMFNQIVSTLEDPVKHLDVIAKDIVMNGKNITVQVEESIESFRAGKYVEFGQQFGNALYYATEEDKNLFLY